MTLHGMSQLWMRLWTVTVKEHNTQRKPLHVRVRACSSESGVLPHPCWRWSSLTTATTWLAIPRGTVPLRAQRCSLLLAGWTLGSDHGQIGFPEWKSMRLRVPMRNLHFHLRGHFLHDATEERRPMVPLVGWDPENWSSCRLSIKILLC